VSKCDLHIHSRYSARSEEWLFRRLDFPDSYSDPKQLHVQLRERGMDYVTVTDHDTIDGLAEAGAAAATLNIHILLMNCLQFPCLPLQLQNQSE